MTVRLLLAACFSAFLFIPSWANADGEWYKKDLHRLIKENNCRVSAYRSSKEPLYFLLTPEYFVTWCEGKPDKKPGKIICLDPGRSAESNEKKGTGRIIACRREYVDVSQELPSYDLIVLTSQEGHEWHACPKFIKLGVYSTEPLWIEKNTKPYGQTFSLSQFWVAKNLIEEAEPVASEAPASGHALLYGADAGQILYCYQNQWVMSGYH